MRIVRKYKSCTESNIVILYYGRVLYFNFFNLIYIYIYINILIFPRIAYFIV